MGGLLPLLLTAVIAALAALLFAQRTAMANAETRLAEQLDRGRRDVEAGQRQVEDILKNLPMGIVAIEGGTRRTLFTNALAEKVLAGRYPDKLPLVDEDGTPLPTSSHPFGGKPVPSTPTMYTLVNDAGTQHLCISSMVIADAIGGSEIIHTIQDETSRIESEKALERSHRLEALGTLTSGIAHDFNNLLTPILGGLDMARRDDNLSERSHRGLDRALQATNSASALIDRLRSFSRQQEMESRPVGLGDLVEGAYDLFGRKLGPGVTAYISARTNPTVEVDPSQFELVMLNLLVNARDAFDNGGEVRVLIEEEDLDDGDHGLTGGSYARLSVTDDGRGMDEVTLKRCIEPFFTTKPAGTASGLGLSMVDGFAAQSGGAMAIDSRPGHGTRVDVWLPATGASAARETAEAEPYVTPSRILLVDDDDMVRSATADMLTDMGHTVVQVSSGAAGIATAHKDRNIRAIISDHLMPGMTGGVMAHEIWDAMPDMPILLISGYSRTRGMPTDIPHLAKPFRRGDLAQALKTMLEPKA